MNKVIFLCTENSGRSQIAKALFNKQAKKLKLNWKADSAGIFPDDKLNPKLKDLESVYKIDLSKESPTKLDFDKLQEYNLIVSFGCIVKDSTEKMYKVKVLEWPIEDVKNKDTQVVMHIAEHININIINLCNKLS